MFEVFDYDVIESTQEASWHINQKELIFLFFVNTLFFVSLYQMILSTRIQQQQKNSKNFKFFKLFV
jgi:hypothetical protein